MKLMETSIPVQFTEIIKVRAFSISPTFVEPIYQIAFTTIAHFLQLTKEKKKVALKIFDENGTFLFAAVTNYHPNEDPEMPGNYTMEFTFDEDDLDGATIYQDSDQNFIKLLKHTAFDIANMNFKFETDVLAMFRYAYKALHDWLKVNTGEVVASTFVASAGEEEGERFMSIVPDGILKRLIKDDASLESDVSA
jgi:hypothetical protein